MPNLCATQGHTPNTLRLNSPPGYPGHEEGHHSTNHIPQEIRGVHQNRNTKTPPKPPEFRNEPEAEEEDEETPQELDVEDD